MDLGDIYRSDEDGSIWRVKTMCMDPQATFERLDTEHRLTGDENTKERTHVIGCLNMKDLHEIFKSPPA